MNFVLMDGVLYLTAEWPRDFKSALATYEKLLALSKIFNIPIVVGIQELPFTTA
jgi:hypothetical protein